MYTITRRFLMLLAAGTLVFSATSASAQLRQTKLFIDGGNSNFASINATGLGAAATVSIPSTAASSSNFILSVLAGGQTIDAGGSASVLTIGSGSTGNDITGNGWYVNHTGGITAANVTAGNVTDDALGSGDIVFAGAAGLLSTNGALTWNGTSLGVTGAIAASGNATVGGTLGVTGLTSTSGGIANTGTITSTGDIST